MGSYPRGANGFARVDPRRPIAFAICDRCGQRYNRTDLVWQFEWAGAQIQNQRILVCVRKCLDIPNEQLRAYSPPADPLPVANPRPDLSVQGPLEVTNLVNNGGVLMLTSAFGWPTSPVGLQAGQFWSNALVVNVVAGGVPFPGPLPPMFFGTITSDELLTYGGSALPTSPPANASELWNNVGVVNVGVGFDSMLLETGFVVLLEGGGTIQLET